MLRSKLLALVLLMSCTWGFAAETVYPSKPLELIVPFAPGGLTDSTSRMFAHLLGVQMGRAIEVKNYPGQHAQQGALYVATSLPDGHTLLAITVTHAANAILMPNSGYKLQNDLTGVAFLTAAPLVVVVPTASPIQNLQDLIRASQRRPLEAATAGNGSTPHLTMALFQDLTNTEMQPVPHLGGSLAIDSLLRGEVDVVFSNIPQILEPLRAGRLRALAITDTVRHPLLPHVPTAEEAGLKGLISENWGAIVVPKGTPETLIGELSAKLEAMANNPLTREQASQLGLSVRFIGHQDFKTHMQRELQKWQNLIIKHHITPGWFE